VHVRAFKIWYSDRTAIGRSYADWVSLPDGDVQAVVIYFDERDPEGRPQRIVSSGCDEYALDTDLHYSSSFDSKPKGDFRGHVKLGRWMDWEGLLLIEQESFNDYGEWMDV
jgi:hypothetical protein